MTAGKGQQQIIRTDQTKLVSHESGVSTHSQRLAVNMEAEKYPLSEVVTPQQLVKI
jgi:hypothetical protein